jgi:undecaprenyl-diphosphatase
MNIFDTSIIAFLNDASHRALSIDKIMMTLVDFQLLKGGFVFAVIWGLWFRRTDDLTKARTREQIIATLLACFFSLCFARLLAFNLPFRIRPMYIPEFQFIYSSEWNALHYTDWSSFPSDHAALFFTLAAGIFIINKCLGVMISAYVFLIVCFPRIYLGLHYPTDILAGALLGIAVGGLFNLTRIRERVTKPFINVMNNTPAIFYASLFLVTFEMGNLFWNVRTLVLKAYKLLFVYM